MADAAAPAATSAPPAGAQPRATSKWLATLAVMLGMMTTIMASTMVNVAIADIIGAFGVGQDRVHWVSTGFLSATTVFMLLNAWFIHNFGARNTLLLAGAVFTVASVFGHLSPTFEGLVLARVVQGACAGIVQPLSLSVIFSVFPPRERGYAMGLFGVGTMLGPALGPLYGGIIIDTLDWRYVFIGPLPFMWLGVAIGARYLPGRAEDAPRIRLNWLSLGLVSVAITAFLNGVTHGQRDGWDTTVVVVLLVTAALATLAFIEVESRTERPLLNVRLFRIRSFAVVSLVSFVFGAGMFGSFYLVPVFVRTVQGFTGTKAGLLFLASELVTFAVFPVAGWLIHRVGPVYPVAGGMFVFSVSSLVLSGVDVDSTFLWLVFWISFGRIGLGLAIPATAAAGLRDLSPELLAYGAGTMNFIRMLGGAMGVNCVAMVLDARAAYYADLLAATQTSMSGATGGLVDGVVSLLAYGGVSSAEQLPYALIYLGDVIAARAHAMSFRDGYLTLAVAFSVATVFALTLARGGGPQSESAPR